MKRSPEIRVERADLLSQAAQRLISALNEELTQRYPEEGANNFRLEPEEVSPIRGGFFIAWRGEAAVGCVAVRSLDREMGEIKRMYVIAAERRQGVGRRLLEEAEACVHALGKTRLVLETGIRQPESLALYSRFGFLPIGRFGEYEESPLSIFLSKQLLSQHTQLP